MHFRRTTPLVSPLYGIVPLSKPENSQMKWTKGVPSTVLIALASRHYSMIYGNLRPHY